jgi:hypothetical protein
MECTVANTSMGWTPADVQISASPGVRRPHGYHLLVGDSPATIIVDFADCNLQVVSCSTPVDGIVSRHELSARVHVWGTPQSGARERDSTAPGTS